MCKLRTSSYLNLYPQSSKNCTQHMYRNTVHFEAIFCKTDFEYLKVQLNIDNY